MPQSWHLVSPFHQAIMKISVSEMITQNVPVQKKTSVYLAKIFTFFFFLQQSRCFQLHAIKNNAVINTLPLVSIHTYLVISSWRISRNGIIGSNVATETHRPIAFQKGCTDPHCQGMGDGGHKLEHAVVRPEHAQPFEPFQTSQVQLGITLLFQLARLCLAVRLDILPCLLTIWISPPVTCPSVNLTHFHLGLLTFSKDTFGRRLETRFSQSGPPLSFSGLLAGAFITPGHVAFPCWS